MEVAHDVVLNDWVLRLCSELRTGCLAANAVTEGKDVLVFLMLQRVSVHINLTVVVGKACFGNKRMRFAGRVNASSLERPLNDLSGVNVAEDSNLLANFCLLDLKHLPAEADVNAALVALVKSDLVGVTELVNLLVGSPVLNSRTLGRKVIQLIMAQEVLVVQRVEVGSFALVGELG